MSCRVVWCGVAECSVVVVVGVAAVAAAAAVIVLVQCNVISAV